jgi:hypothetical protein
LTRTKPSIIKNYKSKMVKLHSLEQKTKQVVGNSMTISINMGQRANLENSLPDFLHRSIFKLNHVRVATKWANWFGKSKVNLDDHKKKKVGLQQKGWHFYVVLILTWWNIRSHMVNKGKSQMCDLYHGHYYNALTRLCICPFPFSFSIL